MRTICRRPRDRGATAVEYGLMIALIAVVISGSVALFGTTVRGLFESLPPSVF